MVASWNVCTLQDAELGARRCTALIACELARYNIDIAALSKTRLPEEGSLVEMKLVKHFSGVAYPQLLLLLLLLLSYHRRLRMILRSARAARGRRSG